MIQEEKERKKILVPISVQTRPGEENSEKNCKKIEKIKKPLSSSIFSQNRLRQAKKERKKIQSRIPFILGLGKKISKKIEKKNQKIKKSLSGIISWQKGRRQAEKEKKKKFQSRILFVPNRARNCQKKLQKKLIFLAKTG